MSLATSDMLASFDNTTKYLDLSPVLAALLINDVSTLGLIGMGSPCNGITHYWNADTLQAQQFVSNDSDMASDAAAVTMTVVDGTLARVGMLLMDAAAGKTEVIQVTGISGNDLTIVRGYGSTSGEVHAADATWIIVGAPVQEGDENITDSSKARTQDDNICQIFKKTVKISGSAEAEANNGMHPGVPSEVRLQLLRRMDEIMIELNRSVILGIKSAAGSDSVYRSMQGLREFLTEATANHRSTSEALSADVLNLMYGDCVSDGGKPETLVGPASQLTKLGSLISGLVRVAPSERMAGVFVDRFLTNRGQQLTAVIDEHFKTDELALIEKAYVKVIPLKGRVMVTEPLAKVGDAIRWQLLGEYTLWCQDNLKRHAYHSNLTV